MKTAVKFSLCVMLMVGCVATDFYQRADFGRYQTFAWGKVKQKVENPIYRSELIDANIKTTIKEELARKGLVYKKSGADLRVSYETYVESKERLTGTRGFGGYGMYSPYPMWPYYWYGYGWGPMMWYSMPMTETHSTGTLVIDFYDRKTGKQVWRGSVSDDVDDADRLERQIQKGVRAIIKKYPQNAPPAVPLGKEKVIG